MSAAEAVAYVDLIGHETSILDDPVPSSLRLSLDPDDEYMVDLARAAAVDALVSGDAHLLELRDRLAGHDPSRILDDAGRLTRQVTSTLSARRHRPERALHVVEMRSASASPPGSLAVSADDSRASPTFPLGRAMDGARLEEERGVDGGAGWSTSGNGGIGVGGVHVDDDGSMPARPRSPRFAWRPGGQAEDSPPRRP